MKILRKKFTFDSSHRLIDPALSEEENKMMFGKCYNFPSHGHTYDMIVGISSELEVSGMIMNFVDVKQIVNDLVVNKIDHQFLNECEMFKGKITTCEVMVDVIWEILDREFSRQAVQLEEIELFETRGSSALRKR